TRTSRLPRWNSAKSALKEASHAWRSRPARRSTSREEPTFTTTRRKSASVGIFMAEYRGFKPAARAEADALSQLRFVLQLRLVLKAIIAGQAADELAPFPIVKNAADILARNARHRGNIALTDFLADDDAARADILAEMVRQLEQGRSHPALERQEASGSDDDIGFAQ